MRRFRRASTLILLGSALVVSLSSPAATPPTVVATLAGYATPVLQVNPGDRVTFRSTDIQHTFSTTDGVCDSAGSVPAGCNVSASVLATGTISIHSETPPGTYEFYCGFHPLWMRGLITVR